jgi:hypothetical protein
MRRWAAVPAILFAVVSTAGCERPTGLLMDSPEARPLRLAIPERSFRLEASERVKIAPVFDADALERLLGMTRPDMRDYIKSFFLPPEPGERSRGALTEIHDPQLQEVLEEVWAPIWDHEPDEVLYARVNPYYYPGREVAKRRREERRHAQSSTPAVRPEQ